MSLPEASQTRGLSLMVAQEGECLYSPSLSVRLEDAVTRPIQASVGDVYHVRHLSVFLCVFDSPL